MTTHSFAPKLTDGEYHTLSRFTRDTWEEYPLSDGRALANRGLLDTERKPHVFSGWNMPTGRYRLSRRGERMCQRYPKDVARRERVAKVSEVAF